MVSMAKWNDPRLWPAAAFFHEALDVLEPAGREVVDDRHATAPLYQGVGQMGADEPGAARDQHALPGRRARALVDTHALLQSSIATYLC